MNKEMIKEMIKMFLQNEIEAYKTISEMDLSKEVKDRAKDMITSIESLEKHIEAYDSTFEVICENLNKKEKKTSKNK